MKENQHWWSESSEPSVGERKRRLIAATFGETTKEARKERKKPRRQDTRRFEKKRSGRYPLRRTGSRQSTGRSVFRLRVGRDVETGELAEPRGLSVNELASFIGMPLSRAAMQPSCWGAPEQVCGQSGTQSVELFTSTAGKYPKYGTSAFCNPYAASFFGGVGGLKF